MACLSARLGALISLVLAWCASCPGRAPFAAGSSAHLPGTARPFQQLDPFEAARVARECLARYSQLAPDDPDYGLETSWAGRVLCNESSPVIAGPLVPKAGSSLLRVLFGDENRPTSLTNLSVILEQRVAARDAAGTHPCGASLCCAFGTGLHSCPHYTQQLGLMIALPTPRSVQALHTAKRTTSFGLQSCATPCRSSSTPTFKRRMESSRKATANSRGHALQSTLRKIVSLCYAASSAHRADSLASTWLRLAS